MKKKIIKNIVIFGTILMNVFSFQVSAFAKDLPKVDNKLILEEDSQNYDSYRNLPGEGALYDSTKPEKIKIPTGRTKITHKAKAASRTLTATKDTDYTNVLANNPLTSDDYAKTNFPLKKPIVKGALAGEVKGLTLLIDFPDQNTTLIDQSEIDGLFNEKNYTGYDNKGSVRDYFYDVSGNVLDYTNTVTFYYTTKENRDHYENQSYGVGSQELIKEALKAFEASNPEYFNDLTTHDYYCLPNPVRKAVSYLNVMYEGKSPSTWAKGLWPHRGYFSNPVSLTFGDKDDKNDLIFTDYEISDIKSSLSIGTIVHETGHMLCGWPDTYSYSNTLNTKTGIKGEGGHGTGSYTIMSNSDDKKNPLWPDPYCRNRLSGWGNVTKINDLSSSTLNASADDHDIFIYNTSNKKEYFMIENMDNTGRRASLPDKGLMIWHIDESVGDDDSQRLSPYGSNLTDFSGTPINHYRLSVVQADGAYDLEKPLYDSNKNISLGNYGDPSDLFGGYDINSYVSSRSFTANTAVNSKMYNGTDSGLSISEISDPGKNITFKVVNGGKPTAPVIAGLSNRSGLQIEFNWKPSTDDVLVDHYRVYADIDNGTSSSRSELGETTSQQYSLTLDLNKTYSFYVVGVDNQGNESEPSAPFVYTTDATAPTQPTGLTNNHDDLTSTSVSINWNASSNTIGDTKYRVYNGTTLIGETEDTSYIIDGLTPSTDYSFTVVAYDRNDFSGTNTSVASDELKVKTLATVETTISGSNVRFSWRAVENAAYYDIDLNGGVNRTPSLYYDLNMQAETTYKFYVTAYDYRGNVLETSEVKTVSNATKA